MKPLLSKLTLRLPNGCGKSSKSGGTSRIEKCRQLNKHKLRFRPYNGFQVVAGENEA
jgi:hypothetical protein